MCIRDRYKWGYKVDLYDLTKPFNPPTNLDILLKNNTLNNICLLYTSDAADERSSVDLGGRRIIKKQKKSEQLRASEITEKTKNKHVDE